jgi:hypothetical protein
VHNLIAEEIGSDDLHGFHVVVARDWMPSCARVLGGGVTKMNANELTDMGRYAAVRARSCAAFRDWLSLLRIAGLVWKARELGRMFAGHFIVALLVGRTLNFCRVTRKRVAQRFKLMSVLVLLVGTLALLLSEIDAFVCFVDKSVEGILKQFFVACHLASLGIFVAVATPAAA